MNLAMNSFQALKCHRLTIIVWIYCISFCLGLIPYFVVPSIQHPIHLFLTLPFGMFSGTLVVVGLFYMSYKLMFGCGYSSNPEDKQNPYDVEFPETRKAQDYTKPYDNSDNESSDDGWDTTIPEVKIV